MHWQWVDSNALKSHHSPKCGVPRRPVWASGAQYDCNIPGASAVRRIQWHRVQQGAARALDSGGPPRLAAHGRSRPASRPAAERGPPFCARLQVRGFELGHIVIAAKDYLLADSEEVCRLRHSSPGTVSLAVAENDDDARLKSGRNYHNAEFLVTTGATFPLCTGAASVHK